MVYLIHIGVRQYEVQHGKPLDTEFLLHIWIRTEFAPIYHYSILHPDLCDNVR